jgi:flavoprotein
MREVGVERFRLTFYKIVKGGFPILITNRKRPKYVVLKVEERPADHRKCELCHRVRDCFLLGVDLEGELRVLWACTGCEARMRAEGVKII